MEIKNITEWLKFLLLWLIFARVWGFDLLMQVITIAIVIIMAYDLWKGDV